MAFFLFALLEVNIPLESTVRKKLEYAWLKLRMLA